MLIFDSPSFMLTYAWDRIKELILRRCGKLNFTYHGYFAAAGPDILLPQDTSRSTQARM